MKFPGRIYSMNGYGRDRRGAHLTIETLQSFEHRAMVSDQPGTTTCLIWALDECATFAAIPWTVREHGLGYMIGGGGILLLSNHLAPVKDVQSGLLAELADFAEREARRREMGLPCVGQAAA